MAKRTTFKASKPKSSKPRASRGSTSFHFGALAKPRKRSASGGS